MRHLSGQDSRGVRLPGSAHCLRAGYQAHSPSLFHTENKHNTSAWGHPPPLVSYTSPEDHYHWWHPRNGASIKHEQYISSTAKYNLFTSSSMLLENEHGRQHTSIIRRLKQEGHELKASLDHIASSRLLMNNTFLILNAMRVDFEVLEHKFRLPQITCSNKLLISLSFYTNKAISKDTFQIHWKVHQEGRLCPRGKSLL